MPTNSRLAPWPRNATAATPARSAATWPIGTVMSGTGHVRVHPDRRVPPPCGRPQRCPRGDVRAGESAGAGFRCRRAWEMSGRREVEDDRCSRILGGKGSVSHLRLLTGDDGRGGCIVTVLSPALHTAMAGVRVRGSGRIRTLGVRLGGAVATPAAMYGARRSDMPARRQLRSGSVRVRSQRADTFAPWPHHRSGCRRLADACAPWRRLGCGLGARRPGRRDVQQSQGSGERALRAAGESRSGHGPATSISSHPPRSTSLGRTPTSSVRSRRSPAGTRDLAAGRDGDVGSIASARRRKTKMRQGMRQRTGPERRFATPACRAACCASSPAHSRATTTTRTAQQPPAPTARAQSGRSQGQHPTRPSSRSRLLDVPGAQTAASNAIARTEQHRGGMLRSPVAKTSTAGACTPGHRGNVSSRYGVPPVRGPDHRGHETTVAARADAGDRSGPRPKAKAECHQSVLRSGDRGRPGVPAGREVKSSSDTRKAPAEGRAKSNLGQGGAVRPRR